MSGAPFVARIVRCASCGGASLYAASNPARPFCSPRCKENDFGGWASEAYRVEPVEPVESVEVAEPPNEPGDDAHATGAANTFEALQDRESQGLPAVK